MTTASPDPVGSRAPDTTHYGPGALPTSGWSWWNKRGATQMAEITGPCIVETVTGPHPLPIGWHGFLAVDSEGFPYPIDAGVHRATYTPAGG